MNLQKIKIPERPHRKILATDIDYYSLFLLLEKQNKDCYIFESLSEDSRQDQHTSFGFKPLFKVSAKANILYFEGDLSVFDTQEKTASLAVPNPYYSLRDFFPQDLACKTREGGLIGYISYEGINYFDTAIDLPEHPDFHQFNLGFYDHGLIYHSITKELEYYYYFEDKSLEVVELLKKLTETSCAVENIESIIDLGITVTRDEYTKMVESTFAEIQEGNTFQVEVGFKNKYLIEGRKMKIYDHLRSINPSPYMIYTKADSEEIIGASPEILISCVNNYVITTPTAGTTPRGVDEASDIELTNILLSDIKEVAEHSMLVDLHRNDIGKIAKLKSVKVEELMHIIKFSHVQHIVSKIVCEKDPQYDAFDVLASICPGGVLTGVPKIETIKIINRNEKEPRGPYGGAVGRFSLNGDCSFALPIRTLFCSGNKCFTQTCSGVVLDSVIEKEYQEIQSKVAAMKLAIMKTSENI